jgi:ribosomal subunit interface protein
MKINISGHHVDVTDGIKQSIESKFNKISKHYPSIMTINSTISVEQNRQKVEVTTNFEGVSVSVNATDKTLYAAIASAAKKLQVALARRKGVLTAKLNKKFVVKQSNGFEMMS